MMQAEVFPLPIGPTMQRTKASLAIKAPIVGEALK